MSDCFIGLMSGTSLDGVDGVLVNFNATNAAGSMRILAHVHHPFPTELASEFLKLNTAGVDELHRAGLAGNALARLYGEVTQTLLAESSMTASRVVAIGAHGQTVRHRPREFDGTGYTVQVNNAALLAELCGIDVIADFRVRDVAAGGQGAPLVPAFHRAFFSGPAGQTVAVLNLGGMSNLSILAPDRITTGFDCGPGNVLMDHWSALHLQQPCDWGGKWAASGLVDPRLLEVMQSEPYFGLAGPKSTGRDLFNADWLTRCLQKTDAPERIRPEDVQATLADLTVWACQDSLLLHAPDTSRLLVCGGGAMNNHLMALLQQKLPGIEVGTTAEHGIPVDCVEAVAFAWLARCHIKRQHGNLPAVTGAAGLRLLGALYPAG